jgi:predicted nucleotidyltransferase component of viral defense system
LHIDLIEIRRTILTAVAADDYLVEHLVLKGGNALELVHQIGARASVDLDFSIAADFEDPEEVAGRLEASLTDRFDSAGHLVFDFQFGPRPSDREHGAHWGGYNAQFKLISREDSVRLGRDIEKMRRQSEAAGPSQQRNFRIEISAFEYVDGSIPADIDHYTVYVYSLDMIAAEKLRAICQQSRRYPQRKHPTARARDFYDIVTLLEAERVSFDAPSFQSVLIAVFQAKDVNLSVLGSLSEDRDFHREEWPRVEDAVRKSLKDFDYYFNYLAEEVRLLEPLWVEDSPP